MSYFGVFSTVLDGKGDSWTVTPEVDGTGDSWRDVSRCIPCIKAPDDSVIVSADAGVDSLGDAVDTFDDSVTKAEPSNCSSPDGISLRGISKISEG